MSDLIIGIYDQSTLVEVSSPNQIDINLDISEDVSLSEDNSYEGDLDLSVNTNDSATMGETWLLGDDDLFIEIDDSSTFSESITDIGMFPLTLHQKVKLLLWATLQREPTDDEVINGTIDYNTTGLIGGFDIGEDFLSITDYENGNMTKISSGDTAFQTGPKDAPTCTITRAGVLSATGAIISGNITAQTGNIGGFEIGPTDISVSSGSNKTTVSSGLIPFSAGPASDPTFKVTQEGFLSSVGMTSINTKAFTSFETTGRFWNQVNTGIGAINFGITGMQMSSAGGAVASSKARWYVGPCSGNSTLTTSMIINVANADDTSYYLGIGALSVASTGITFTETHIGFKIIGNTADGYKYYGTVANGGVETTTLLATVSGGNSADLALKVTSNTSVEFYYRRTDQASLGSWIKGTITSGIPTLSGVSYNDIQFACSSDNTNASYNLQVLNAGYER